VEYKYRNGRRKYLLKRLAERLGVPRELLDRPKRGFAIPLVYWMRNELKTMLQDVLLDGRTLERGYFRRSGIEQLLQEHFRRRRDHSGVLWMLLIFELWHRNFLEASRDAPSTISRLLPQTVGALPAGTLLEPTAAGPPHDKLGS
jgi:asparagine synthase (glutamine-hydrolysing)